MWLISLINFIQKHLNILFFKIKLNIIYFLNKKQFKRLEEMVNHQGKYPNIDFVGNMTNNGNYTRRLTGEEYYSANSMEELNNKLKEIK